VLLGALADCVEGHQSLRQKAGLLHRDISIGNLVVRKDGRGMLIDLDLAAKEERSSASGAKGRTGTRAFMAIGVLQNRQHTYTHDLESFFWVLFWICIHYYSPGKDTVVPKFDK
jgi:serine/threonine protein kinase